MTTKAYWLALHHAKGVGPALVARCLAQLPSVARLFECSSADLQALGFNTLQVEALQQVDWALVQRALDWERAGAHRYILTWDDVQYPPLLREIHDPPFVLYAWGNLQCLQRKTLAIVGTRKPTPAGVNTATSFARILAKLGVTLVSGLALGIDAAVHRGCLEAEGATVAVMGTGIDTIYPRSHRKLAQCIGAEGLLLTEFGLGTPPLAGHFPRRNRIISGLSLATLVVESAMKSGSLITARCALEQNRGVLAVPGSIYNVASQGCHHLLQQGARLVTCCEDVLEELDWTFLTEQAEQCMVSAERIFNNAETVKNRYSQQLDFQLGASERAEGVYSQSMTDGERTGNNAENSSAKSTTLLDCVGFEPTSIERIMAYFGGSITELMAHLSRLEVAGMIQSVPGGYIRCV
ncbi:MAG: DNA-processing protein DprA [Legionellaceae bacterium]|nr:DNA-processing protein DprA [Legionellaceae bacterium]